MEALLPYRFFMFDCCARRYTLSGTGTEILVGSISLIRGQSGVVLETWTYCLQQPQIFLLWINSLWLLRSVFSAYKFFLDHKETKSARGFSYDTGSGRISTSASTRMLSRPTDNIPPMPTQPDRTLDLNDYVQPSSFAEDNPTDIMEPARPEYRV